MKRFIVEDSFWDLFPGASLGVVVAQGMKTPDEVPAQDAQEISALLAQANIKAQAHLENPTLSANAPVRVWREAYQKFKTKRGARCSIENLLKRVLKDNPVGSISPSVDIYNAMSLTYALPLGGEDIDTFQGDLRLTITAGGDAFIPLGEHAEEDPTLPGGLCYVDEIGAVCRCWNWRDGVRTALTDTTRNAFLIVECVDPERIDACQAATNELTTLVERYLGANILVSTLVTSENREVVIEP